MSRKLGSTECIRCKSPYFRFGNVRSATAVDVRGYEDYVGMSIRDATCKKCGALYTAWVGSSPHSTSDRVIEEAEITASIGFHDLSFRSTFNDEPGEVDLPPWSEPQSPAERSRQPSAIPDNEDAELHTLAVILQALASVDLAAQARILNFAISRIQQEIGKNA